MYLQAAKKKITITKYQTYTVFGNALMFLTPKSTSGNALILQSILNFIKIIVSQGTYELKESTIYLDTKNWSKPKYDKYEIQEWNLKNNTMDVDVCSLEKKEWKYMCSYKLKRIP